MRNRKGVNTRNTLPAPLLFDLTQLASLNSNNIAENPVRKMFKNVSNCDLSIVIILRLEKENRRFMKNSGNAEKHKLWVHAAWKRRPTEREFSTLLPHLLDDETKFYQYFRMTMLAFNLLEVKLQKELSKQDTYFRRAITPRNRLAVFLRKILY